MAKHKLKQFAELNTFSNVYHHVQTQYHVPDFKLKGQWGKKHFKNENPIVLELGCGKGEYTTAMAQAFPNKNFIGVDLKGNRLWTGAKKALEQSLSNVAFLRTRIENITTAFAPHEIDEIWITFPDPQPEEKRAKKRLTEISFLNRYREIIKPSGILHLKTDSQPLYTFTLDVIQQYGHCLLLSTPNLYQEPNCFLGEHHELLVNIKTHYEKKFSAMGFNITYIRFQLK